MSIAIYFELNKKLTFVSDGVLLASLLLSPLKLYRNHVLPCNGDGITIAA